MAIFHKSKPVAILEWDWRQQPDFDEIGQIVLDFQSRFSDGIKIKYIETGSDEHAIVIGSKSMTDNEAEAHFVNRYDYDEGKDPAELDWDFAQTHLNETRKNYFDIGAAGVPALTAVINPLFLRFEKGERTVELHEAIISLS